MSSPQLGNWNMAPSEADSETKSAAASVVPSRCVVIIFTQENFYLSHMRHFCKLKKAIEQKFGRSVEVLRVEAANNAEFDVCIRMISRGTDGTGTLHKSSQGLLSVSMPQRSRMSTKSGVPLRYPGRLLFSKLREGFFPTPEALLTLIDLSVRNNQAVARELRKVECVGVFSQQNPEYAHRYRSLVGQATSQLIDNVKFYGEAILVPEIFEIWINGYLVYSMWSCQAPPVLHDIITELQRAVDGQPINSMPKIRFG